MAKLYYGTDSAPVEVASRLLAHLKVVVTTKLRRNESFTLTILHLRDEAMGRTTLWIQPSIPLRFAFEDREPVELDPALLTRLALSANSRGGIVVDLEDAALSLGLPPDGGPPARRAA